jgi:ribosome-binding ATPase YchF (GTP1/OBG family)
LAQVQESLDKLGIKEPSGMETWDEDMVKKVVKGFMDVRFPTVFVLNKIDLPESDNNIMRICQKYGSVRYTWNIFDYSGRTTLYYHQH